MTPGQLSTLLVDLLAQPNETEWVEWKHNFGHDSLFHPVTVVLILVCFN
jgi:hypothetical protein